MTFRGFPARVWALLVGHMAFFLPFALWLIAGAVALLMMEQGDAIFFFNGKRTAFGDAFFQYATLLGEGIFFVAAFFALLFVGFRYAAVLPWLGLMVSITTQGSKRLFGHPRPFAYFRDEGLTDLILPIEGVEQYMGMTSFPSGHTLAAFALFAYLALCTPYKRFSGFLFFLLALLVALSRIYLVHHFLKDVYLGSLLGTLLALAFFLLAEYLPASRYPWLDQRLVRR